MNRQHILLLLTGAFMISGLDASQAQKILTKDDDIDTNRPSFSQSALVVPMGSLQLENGSLYQSFQHGLTYFDLPETEVRVGLLKGTELQMFTPNVLFNSQAHTSSGSATGLNEVGLKHQFKTFRRLTASFVGGVDLPTGSRNRYIPHIGVSPVFRVPYAIQLTKTLALAGTQSIILTQNHGSIQYQPFVMVTKLIGRKTTMFAEYAGFFQQNSHATGVSIAHFGGWYKLNRHHQVDFQFGFGLSKTAPTAFVGVGYSYRFDGLPWGNRRSGVVPTPTKSSPVTSSHEETSPAKSSPAESLPARTSPARSSPAESSPARSSPAESSPAKSLPAEPSPDQP